MQRDAKRPSAVRKMKRWARRLFRTTRTSRRKASHSLRRILRWRQASHRWQRALQVPGADVRRDGAIVLVGNGPSLASSGLGPAIDGFDHVLRFNNFPVDGYEPHVGTKTTIWARSDYKIEPRDAAAFDHVLVCLPPHKTRLAKTREDLRYPNRELGDPELIEAAAIIHGVPFGSWLSSGIIAILWAIERWPQVHIVGFDHFVAHDRETIHYYEHQVNERMNHVPDVEGRIVAALTRHGRVRRLASPDFGR